MPELLKPAKRGPKPRKRIPAVRAKGKRKKVTRREQRKRLAKLCNDLWSFIVKARVQYTCQSPRSPHECSRVWQAAHGFGKKVHPATRYELWNGRCLCSSEHTYFGHREAIWFEHLRDLWGDNYYKERLAEACATAKHDLESVYSGLRAEVLRRRLEAQARERGLL